MSIERVSERPENFEFSGISEAAFSAVAQTCAITHDGPAVTVNKALIVNGEAVSAERRGGGFTLQRRNDAEPAAARYETHTDRSHHIRIDLIMSAQLAMILALPEGAGEGEYVDTLDIALRRWRDINVTRFNGGKVYLQESADATPEEYWH